MEASLPHIASILFFVTLAVYAMLVIFMLVWVYHDAESRGVTGWVVVVPVFMTGTLLGLVLWLILRPSPKPEPVLIRVRNR